MVGRRQDQPTPRSIAVDGNARSWIEMIAARGAGGVNPVRAVVSTYSDHSFTRRRPTGCLRTWVCVIGRAATYSSSRQLVAHPTKVSQMGNIGEAVRASTERCHNIERKPYGCRGRAPRPRRWIQGHHCAVRRPETPCESFLDYDFAPRCFLHRPPRAAASALMKKWSLHTITSRHSVPPPLNFVGRSTMGPR